MTIILELTPEAEARLRRKAEREGQEVAEYLLALADGDAEEEGSAYDLFAEHIGRIHGSHEPLSQDCGERFTQYLVEKQDAEHL